MISLYGLFILLLTAEAIHAQGDTNDGDDANQAFGLKKAASLIQGTTSTTLPTTLQESNTPNQSGASSSADLQPEEECGSLRWLRKISRSCPQQQSPPEPQPSTSQDPPQPDKMPLPAYFRVGIFKYYTYFWITNQYPEFTKEEAMYFKSKYSPEKKLGQGKYGAVYLAIRKSDGMEVACKSIPKSDVRKYTLESTPLPICHLRNPLVGSEEPSFAQCMSSRPPDLPVPYEFMLQMYLSQPGHDNPYVPGVIDYFILKDKYIVVMEYIGGKWVSLSSYLMERKHLDVSKSRDIIREIVNAMISLKQYGVLHDDIHDKNVMYNKETGGIKLIDFGVSNVLPGWVAGKSLPLKSSDLSSTSSDYKAGFNELHSMQNLGRLLYMIITGKSLYIEDLNYGEFIREAILPDPDPSKFELQVLGKSLTTALIKLNSNQVHSIEAIFNDPFFD
ncbi:hypothetical protein BASA50_002167 [Batrachochytrium salamandrivorans]|uniref:non-specific serine/threonine protein kinase n=1 Tax=Batrachochytrium salamandrivorans TaxID=1357716 RepID=A0ABQ8FM22_9FUNG|nr:hypothetical protein BASA50_002167 [Batrachochytrium salamandrivorans]